MTAVLSGETQASSVSTGSALPHLKSGPPRALAATGLPPLPALPHAPTIAEQGPPAATITGWFAFLAPARTPRAVVDKLNTDIRRVLQSPEVGEQMAREGSEPSPGTPEELG